ncbi:MAG: endonuclease [Bacilli bacterium]|nr:endonuclease [Bacilli bacterium]
MKFKKSHLYKIGAFTAVLTLNISLYVNLNKKPVEALNAYSTSDLPTTINLNDCSDSEIRSYYSGLNSLDASQRKGTNLLKNLKTILSNGQKYYNYDSGDNVWKMYEITDRDWVKSPANAINYGTYNSNTNTITGYKYGSNYDNPYLHALYVNRNVANHNTRAWGDHTQTNYGINREHIWAKSHGFQAEGAAGARGDPMHLWAANGYANNKHSNYFFAFVDKTRSYDNCGSAYSYISGNYKGYSKNLGGNQNVFEPQDSDKGDIARAVFYMVARYNNYAGNDNSIGTNNPNLVLANNLSENSRTGTSTANDPYAMGVLSDLLAWNKLDPVDEYEKHRNNLLYRNFTNNRNPFIDFPSWADAIWGTADLDGTNYNSSITTVANPALDSINSGAAGNAFNISVGNLDLEVGDTAEIYGSNANGNITWTVSDNTVVSLSKNSSTNNEIVTITALKSGNTTITATSGGNSETCTITVSDSVINYGSPEHPLTITQAKQVIDTVSAGSLTPEKMYVKGIISSNTAFNTKYNNYDHVWLQSEDGQTTNAFDLRRSILDDSITDDYSAANSMQGLEAVAYGFGEFYNSTYQLFTDANNQNNPLILSLEPVVIPEKTPQEKIEEITTTTKLSYRYTSEESEGSVTDTLNKAFTGRTATKYEDWTNDGVSGVTYVGQSAAGNNAIQLRSNNNNSGIVVSANPNSLPAASITVAWNQNTEDGRTLNVYGKSTAYSAATDLYNANSQGTLLGTIVYGTNTSLTITGSYPFIGFRSSSGALWLDEVQIVWGSGSSTTYEYSDVSIRFGGLLSQDLWNDLDTENHVIEGFGVMITTYDVLEGEDIKDYYDNAEPAESDPDIEDDIINHYMDKTEMSVPPEQDDNYFWNLFFRITDYTKVYTAAAYIKTSSEYVFFGQVTYSVKTLAEDYIANRGYSASAANGSLGNLANLSVN